MKGIINQGYEQQVPLAKLQPHPRNARQGDVGAIHQSIEHNGFFGACVVQMSTNRILVGNHRYFAAQEAGLDSVPVIWVDCDDDEALKILLADNKTNDAASYDDNKLAEVLADLNNRTGSLEGTGYTPDDLDELIANLSTALSEDVKANRDKNVEEKQADFDDAVHGRQIVLIYPIDDYEQVVVKLEVMRIDQGAESYAQVVKRLVLEAPEPEGVDLLAEGEVDE